MKLAVTHHTLSASANDAIQLTAEKSLTFVLDAPKERESGKQPKASKKRKKGGAGLNTKNFGSVIDISKFKDAKRFVVGWRARRPMGNNTGSKTIISTKTIPYHIICTKTIPYLGEIHRPEVGLQQRWRHKDTGADQADRMFVRSFRPRRNRGSFLLDSNFGLGMMWEV